MIITRLPINQLNPAPYNPRVDILPGDSVWKKLERSLDEFDLVQPIVWNERTGHVVSGHQRLAVLKHRGEQEVDCVVVDLSLEKEKALNVTLNNSAVASKWDAKKLVDLVAELQELSDFDATLTGFDEQQLKDLLLAPEMDSAPLDSEENAHDEGKIQATLEIPVKAWEAAERVLDQLLAEEPQIQLHVRK